MKLKAQAEEWMRRLRERRPLLPLRPDGPADPAADEAIGGLLALAGGDPDARAVVSGLLLWNGNLDRSHTISQGIDNATGSYWHGIMHRMEGDYWNAKYWFRRVGRHPAMARLREAAREPLASFGVSGAGAPEADRLIGRLAAAGEWDPFLFVDAVEAQVGGRGSGEARALLEELQHLEMSVLLQYGLERM
jgi:hypothetical protein